MTCLEGKTVRLRAVEPDDVELFYVWENDPDVWSVSGTTAPFSRYTLEKFIESQKKDIFDTQQQRLVIETLLSHKPIGTLDIYDYDLFNGRAGIGILIYEYEERGKGYAADALEVVCEYARTTLRMHQLWCNILADNEACLALFRRAGFTQTGVRRQWHWSTDCYKDEIVMQKILGGSKQQICSEIQYDL